MTLHYEKFIFMKGILIYWRLIVSLTQLSWGGSRTAAASKMERFVIIVNGWKPLTIITKRSILDVAAVLDAALLTLSQSNDNYFAVCILLEILEGLDYWPYILKVTQSFICLSRTNKLLSRTNKSLFLPGKDLGEHLPDFWFVILLETVDRFLDRKECFKKNLIEKVCEIQHILTTKVKVLCYFSFMLAPSAIPQVSLPQRKNTYHF